MLNIRLGSQIPGKNKLLFDFAKAARTAIHDYPQQLAATVFIDGETQRRAASSFPFHKLIKVAIMTRNVLSEVKTQEQRNNGSLAYAWRSREWKSKGMVYRQPSAKYNPSGIPDLAMSAAQIFDHELGHLLTEDGFKANRLKAETSADAFAAIRHFQRFGDRADDLLAASSAMRAMGFFCGAPGHVTTPVIDHIRMDARSLDFNAWSPAETVIAAEIWAAKFNPRPREWSEANRIYRPVIEDFRKGEGLDVIRIAETMLQQPTESLAFRLGAGALDHCFRETPEFFKDPDWQARRAMLRERIDAMGPEGEILRGKMFQTAGASKSPPAPGKARSPALTGNRP